MKHRYFALQLIAELKHKTTKAKLVKQHEMKKIA